MSAAELKRLRTLLTSIYTTWHNCGLRKPERGLKKGRPCDVCLIDIEVGVVQVKGIGATIDDSEVGAARKRVGEKP